MTSLPTAAAESAQTQTAVRPCDDVITPPPPPPPPLPDRPLTSGHLVPAGPQRLEEAEAIDGDQGSGVEDGQLLVLWSEGQKVNYFI